MPFVLALSVGPAVVADGRLANTADDFCLTPVPCGRHVLDVSVSADVLAAVSVEV